MGQHIIRISVGRTQGFGYSRHLGFSEYLIPGIWDCRSLGYLDSRTIGFSDTLIPEVSVSQSLGFSESWFTGSRIVTLSDSCILAMSGCLILRYPGTMILGMLYSSNLVSSLFRNLGIYDSSILDILGSRTLGCSESPIGELVDWWILALWDYWIIVFSNVLTLL